MGSLSSKGNNIIANLGLLTLKIQEIKAHSRVKIEGIIYLSISYLFLYANLVLGYYLKIFSSATEYFYYVAEQDI